MRLHHVLLFSCVLSTLALTTSAQAAPPPKPADATLAPQVTETIVRIDNNGNFVGSGVVVTSEGHVVTTTRVANDQAYQSFTVGPANVKATIVVYDPKHGLAILKAATPLPRWATLDTPPGPAKNDATCVIGRLYRTSDPPMVELRNGPAKIEDPHFRGESAASMDLSDIMIVRLDGDGFDFNATSYPVFSPKTGRLQGIVIGKIEFGQNRLLAMPTATIRALLESKKIAIPEAR